MTHARDKVLALHYDFNDSKNVRQFESKKKKSEKMGEQHAEVADSVVEVEGMSKSDPGEEEPGTFSDSTSEYIPFERMATDVVRLS